MQANEKNNIRIGTMLSDGADEIYRVTHFIFSEGITHKYGNPVEDNVVHVDVYNTNNLKEPIGHKNFVHLNFVEPVPISKEYLDILGFRTSKLNDHNVYRFNDAYFESLTPVNGFYTVKRVSNNEPFAVQYIHQVQIIAANEN
ncbi:hypothetical protein ACQ33O_09440 [Ferruginibacter sp. SUN002]|uniref:hypothetical protein n=1 Tax=Ferruginibacter sp. SUN002 TaxID=2937789 RepID=UPI003D36FB2E